MTRSLQQVPRAGCPAQGIQELQAHIAALQSEPSPLEAARAELAACEGDRAKFLRLLEQLQARPPSFCVPLVLSVALPDMHEHVNTRSLFPRPM